MHGILQIERLGDREGVGSVVGRQRPAVMEYDGLRGPGAPVLVEDVDAFGGLDKAGGHVLSRWFKVSACPRYQSAAA